MKVKKFFRATRLYKLPSPVPVPLKNCFLRACFAPLGVLLVMKTLEDERQGVITAYKLAVLEILMKFVCISIYCVSALSLHIESMTL